MRSSTLAELMDFLRLVRERDETRGKMRRIFTRLLTTD